ncbi:MAG TPA: ectonucleotide pyrophosphatase/phosphodiesterase [Opitutus sp.]|nr:ectonucleotide pyrophosphatase/phosphodiesterase [Opitutus sp.]
MKRRFLAVLGLMWLAVLLPAAAIAAPSSAGAASPLVLISLDGFRWDYCTLFPRETPNLRRLMREGVSARSLIPVFPSNTFPNHYSIVTGLYPSHHGIVDNDMFDASTGRFFHYNQPVARDDVWWRGEPIWVTAVKQGLRSACAFWPGSESEIAGARPTYWKRYDYSIPFERRLDDVTTWLSLPPDERPRIVTFYLEETNSYGHRFGPDAPEMAEAIRLLDERVGRIAARLASLGLDANLVIVSDHGMTGCGPDRVILFDDYLDLESVQIDFDESVAGLRPLPGTSVDAVMAQLRKLPPTARAYRATELPRRFHIDPRDPRNPPIWILPQPGWNILRRATFERFRDRFSKGQHGYDPALRSMRGILIAHGPAFRRDGAVVDPVENVHIYNLLCAAAGLRPAPNDGDARLVRAMLKR